MQLVVLFFRVLFEKKKQVFGRFDCFKVFNGHKLVETVDLVEVHQ